MVVVHGEMGWYIISLMFVMRAIQSDWAPTVQNYCKKRGLIDVKRREIF